MVMSVLAQTAVAQPGAAEFWVFLIVGAVALGSALAMVCMRNAVHAALMLVVNFFTIAVLYAVLEAQFLAVVQIIVYAGAIMVLFLFVIMLLGVGHEEPLLAADPESEAKARVSRWQAPLAILFGILLLGGLVTSVAAPYIGQGSVCDRPAEAGAAGLPCAGLAEVNADGNTEALGLSLYTDYVWPFEVTSVLLVIAVIGAIVLGRREPVSDLVDVVPASASREERP